MTGRNDEVRLYQLINAIALLRQAHRFLAEYEILAHQVGLHRGGMADLLALSKLDDQIWQEMSSEEPHANDEEWQDLVHARTNVTFMDLIQSEITDLANTGSLLRTTEIVCEQEVEDGLSRLRGDKPG